ncbi:hypothetical protein B0H13DRAFT_1858978 [Mycena leptocephala]|nr:hypothetical protein B0H13DRAFT_1858978 [Mycena leptocephala]
MVNSTGKNGPDNGVFPPDDELGKILLEYERRSLSLPLRLCYLQGEHHITIGSNTLPRLTKLKQLNKKFGVPSSRKFTQVEEATAAIGEIIARDVHQGPDMRVNLTVPRYIH